MPTALVPHSQNRRPFYGHQSAAAFQPALWAEKVTRDVTGNIIPTGTKGSLSLWVYNPTGGPASIILTPLRACSESVFHNVQLQVAAGWEGWLVWDLSARWLGASILTATAVELCLAAWREGADGWS